MSLPEHFEGWDVKRAATFRVLVHLWRFADNEKTEVWCFRTDAEVIESCNLRDERHLRECLRDLRLAEVVMRETGSDGRSGFRLYNRAPVSGGKPPAELRRRKAAALPAELRRPSGGTPPPHLLESRRAEEQSVSPTNSFALDPAPPAKTPRKRRSKSGLSDEDAERLFEAQQSARVMAAARLGKRVGAASLLPGLRKAMDKAFERIPDVEGLIQAMAYRGRTTTTQQEYQWLGGPSAWNGIDHAYGNRDDAGGASAPVSSDGSLIDTYR